MCCYIDDILVTGPDEAKHLSSLEEVIQHLEKHGFKLKREKCAFMKPSVTYLHRGIMVYFRMWGF